jgi:murein DD-endopeptidase MepM/ murein hydrolase activator NlpD
MSRFWAMVMILGLATFGCSEQDLADQIDGFATDTGSETDTESDTDTGSDGDEPSDPEMSGDPTEPGEGEPDPGGGPSGEPEDPPSEQAPEPGPCGEFALIWPTTGIDTEQTIVHDAYGPRLLDGHYDWHRGIDLPGHPDDGGFHNPVHAVADGRIHAIGNRPDPGHGALSGFTASAGNVIILEHLEADLHPGMPTLYSVYMHLDEIDVEHFPAIVGDGDTPEPIDLREWFYLDGSDTNANNRGRPRPTFKSSGDPIQQHPRVRQQAPIAIIGDTGATYEHLHFEIRESEPNQTHARNPYAYLPHLDAAMHTAKLEADGAVLRATIEIPRAPGPIGETTDLSQQFDVETISLQILDGQAQLVDELRLSLFDISHFSNADQPLIELEGVEVQLLPADFDSASSSWEIEVEFTGLGLVGLVPLLNELVALEVVDACGNRVTAMLE